MRLPTWFRWLFGMATVWPIVWLAMVSLRIGDELGRMLVSGRYDGSVGVQQGPLALTIVIVAFVVGFTFWHLGRSDPSLSPPKPVWVALLLLCGPFGYPIYWWARIRPQRPPPT